MADPESNSRFAWLEPWLTVERQAPIVGGVLLLLVLWLGEIVTPFVLGIPAYAFYFLFSAPAHELGLVGPEGSMAIFWTGAVLWLYIFCAVLFSIALALSTAVENA